MPSWNDGEESSEEELVGMELEQNWVRNLICFASRVRVRVQVFFVLRQWFGALALCSEVHYCATMQANPDTTIDASFCGRAADASITCRLHLAPCMKYVAFEGIHTSRRFYGCAVQVCAIHLVLGLGEMHVCV